MGTSSIFSYQHAAEGEGNYPFTDYSTFTSVEGTTVPMSMFVDACVYTIGGKFRQYISSITVDATGITIAISDETGVLCTGISTASSSNIYLKDLDGRNVGVLIGNKDSGKFRTLAPGVYTFGPGDLEFVPTCVLPIPAQNVNGLVTNDGDLFTGDVWLVGRDGVYLQWDADREAIVVHIVGDPLFRKRNCENPEAPFTYQRPLQAIRIVLDGLTEGTINPDKYGNVQLTPIGSNNDRNIFRVEQIEHGVKIKAIGSLT